MVRQNLFHFLAALTMSFQFLLFLTILSAFINPTKEISDFYVNPTGRSPCFRTIQSAVDALPTTSKQRIIIRIAVGIYHEKIIITKEKPAITFQGEGYLKTEIVWNDTAKSAGGTFSCGTVQIFSANFVAKNITFKNSAPPPAPGAVGGQAVAVRVGGDMAAFWGCGFYGAQDTLHDDQGHHYFKDCHIHGSIDFIFGMAKSIYENCYIVSIAAPTNGSITGAITANGKSNPDSDSGFVFYRCNISGTGSVYLGRAWRPYSLAIYASTYMSTVVAPIGWNDWENATYDQTVFYGEYNSSGLGSSTEKRASYAKRLTRQDVSPFISLSYIGADQWLEAYS